MKVVDSYVRKGGRIVGLKRDRNSTGRPTESTNLDLWGSQKLNHQPKIIHGLDLGLPAHMWQIFSMVFMCVPNKWNKGISKAVSYMWNMLL